MYMSRKGDVIASAGKRGKSLEAVAAVARDAFEVSLQLSDDMGYGPLKELVVGYTQGPILIRSLESKQQSNLLVVELANFEDLGQTRLHVNRAVEELMG
jgi:predicted regulator of Ras-like GTPase activity (Roadblock/LC7/MglB family)